MVHLELSLAPIRIDSVLQNVGEIDHSNALTEEVYKEWFLDTFADAIEILRRQENSSQNTRSRSVDSADMENANLLSDNTK